MYASSGTGTVSLTTYSNNSTYNDEWNIAKIGYMSETATLEGQQEPAWCWATAARMFAKHYYPQVSITQREAVTEVKGSPINEGGNIGEAEEAIQHYISNIPSATLNTVIKEDGPYTKNQVISFLNSGNVIFVSRFAGDQGHSILIYGYVTIDGGYWFLIRDSLPVDYGESYLMSYEKLCNGQNALATEEADPCTWEDSIVIGN